MRQQQLARVVGIGFALVACGGRAPTAASTDAPLTVTGGSQRVVLAVGQELEVVLGTVGPGMFDPAPDISQSHLRFVDVVVIPPYAPGGPTQRFRFVAVTAGQAVLTFHQVDRPEGMDSRTVSDTVVVR